MKYKNILFDLDGTLLDTISDLTAAVNYAVSAYGYPVYTEEQIKGMVGNGIRNLMIRAIPGGLQNHQFEEIYACFKQYYTAHCKEQTKPYAGIMELLCRLKEAGCQLAIVSNKNAQAVCRLAAAFFGDYITVAIGQGENTRKKPAPDTVFAAMSKLDAKAAETLYVGDSEVDFQTACNAGLDCVLVSWGFRDKTVLEKLGAMQLIDTPDVLLDCI